MKIQFAQLEIKSFDSNEACLKLIAYQKWADGYTCRDTATRIIVERNLFFQALYPM